MLLVPENQSSPFGGDTVLIKMHAVWIFYVSEEGMTLSLA